MFGHVRKVLLGNATAQGLQFVATMVLSRIYTPADFAFVAEVQSIATAVAVVVTLQLHLVIPLAKSDEEARATTELVQTLCIAVGLLGLVPALFLGSAAAYAVLLAPLLGLANTYNSFLVFKGSFGRLGAFYIVRAAVIVSVQIALAQLPIGQLSQGAGLLWGVIAGESLSALYLRLSQVGPLRVVRFELRRALALAKERSAFSVYGTLQELVAVSAFYAPLLLFNGKFGDDIGGQYAMANRLAWAPVGLLAGSLAQVLYHRFGKSIPPAKGEPLPRIGSGPAIATAVLLGSALTFLLPDLFLIVLGPQWTLTSQLLPLQLVWGGFFLLATPYRVASRALQLQRFQLGIDLGMLAAFGLVFWLTELSALHTMGILVAVALLQNLAQAATAHVGLRRAASRSAP
jgi:O-antigen/teichoic acid export membrane protein